MVLPTISYSEEIDFICDSKWQTGNSSTFSPYSDNIKNGKLSTFSAFSSFTPLWRNSKFLPFSAFRLIATINGEFSPLVEISSKFDG
jgi:hypothetical protein